jgi:SAM-dependent methyltransferase
MIDRLCPLCRDTTKSSLFAEAHCEPDRLGEFAYASRKLPEYMHYRLMICGECDVIFASPVPDPAELESAYEAAAFDSQQEAAFAAATYIRTLEDILHRLPDRIGTLDIGAGDGAFCGELKTRGFSEVIGLEPSSAPIASASEQVRDCLRQEMFSPGLFPPAQFSLVTCFQTIEHVSNPAQLCQEATRLLKPGGALCLVAHNRRALSCRMLGRRSPIFDIEHLQLFSPSSLRRLLEDSGLKSVVVKPLFNRYPISYWTRLFPFPPAIKSALLWSLRTSYIGGIPLTLPAGNLLAYGFR